MRLVEAQQARRVLDRLVGYKASPLLWKTVKKGLSAGRVQTVALRLIVEREREIRAFKPQEYWTIAAQMEKDAQRFTATLHAVDGQEGRDSRRTARRAASSIRSTRRCTSGGERRRTMEVERAFPLTEVKRRERRKNPAAPFTTSTLQQEAAKKLGFGSKRTMRVAQDLYEGIEMGDEGAVGLITYMRTDSTRVAESAACRRAKCSRDSSARSTSRAGPQLYGASKKATNTQDAHEAIRPTDPSRRPEDVRRYLKDEQFRLYQLIWQRFMASQMAPAVFDTTTLDFDLAQRWMLPGSAFLFRATGSVVKFPGFLALYRESREEGEGKALEDEQALPTAERGERMPMLEVTPDQHFTEPPPRFSEASLVKELERLGIGRPSTYAQIISTLAGSSLRARSSSAGSSHAVRRERRARDGEAVPGRLRRRLHVGDGGELDKIEEGAQGWRRVLKDFYGPFEASLNTVKVEALIAEAHDLSALETERCPECGGQLVAKGGFFGPFVACENHPKNCKYTRPIKGERKPPELTQYKCHECGAPMVIRHGRSGRLPRLQPVPEVPRHALHAHRRDSVRKDGGEIAERRSKKRGKAFFGCSNYPNCDFVCWDNPVPETCPECGYVGAEDEAQQDARRVPTCLKCGNEWDVRARRRQRRSRSDERA